MSVTSLSQQDIDAALHRFRPLLFGAAWKCVDLALELGLHVAGIGPADKKVYSIAQKVRDRAKATLSPLSHDMPVWDRLVTLYERTSEVRHCLVHRTFQFNGTGDMTKMADRQGNPIPDLTANEQIAFAQAALHALQAVFDTAPDGRTRALLAYQLDQLAPVHKLGILGGGQARPVEHAVQISAQVLPDGQWVVDIDAARAALLKSWPSKPLANVRITPKGADGNPPLVGRLEEAPSGVSVTFDPAVPPPWMRP
jgi:hypothetical protein